MDSTAGKSWGGHSLTLTLPVANIRLDGLSAYQLEALQESYQNFTSGLPKSNISQGSEKKYLRCNIYRIEQPPSIPISELTCDDQYSPKKSRCEQSSSFNVTGMNFEATMELRTSGVSSIGICNEDDLAQAEVIENYLRIISAHKVLQQGGVVLHSAGLVFDEKAYIFSGRSNAGKTTLTRKAFKKGARVLSDDINLVLPAKQSGIYAYDAYAVPFTGEFGRTLVHAGGKESYPLAGIILLEQSDHLETLPVSPSAAVARLLTGCPFVNTDEHESEALFDSVTGLVSRVPVIRLLSRKDDDIDDIMLAVRQQFTELSDNLSLRA